MLDLALSGAAAAAPLKPGAFSSRRYCARFFLSLCACLVLLRKADRVPPSALWRQNGQRLRS